MGRIELMVGRDADIGISMTMDDSWRPLLSSVSRSRVECGRPSGCDRAGREQDGRALKKKGQRCQLRVGDGPPRAMCVAHAIAAAE